ncbi:ribosomal protein L32 [Kwoniella mangroviensis CBS 10435]|uniref:Large ribosomal subunit protein bL32m n=1 Tax=Kwoniella mangroviensis CBS 10435 TaxID=1331196 RepID=A0A1B9IR09_9TREE|nr:ribosomal protein L32 [Kwoniella mangroviensis CBS 8507]OCF57983.1 ribosomal protein L32 [Kwoniella mangroviensis CBS 10435]OCF68239.1 ribosomal protein L32 [Kwoniella mangroviensis CBS 8507]OCF74915.1 ribosomal protein L32 [Kwoniella mangroviensis CBS 8886]
MASLSLSSRSSLISLRPLINSSRPSWSLPCIASSSSSTSTLSVSPVSPIESTIPTASSWRSILPSFSLESILELIPPIVWASVPKKKTSHSRKSMRSANKGLKNRTNLSLCEACGSIKLTHHICPTCYSQISRRWKREARGELPSGAITESILEQPPQQSAQP